MNYLPHTDDDVRRALEAIGAGSVDELFADVPAELRDPELDLPPGMDEATLLRHLRALAAKDAPDGPDFLGGGLRRRFIPAVTPALALQSEFVTAYTPYQPEVSQGILQATFEYQTMMAELTGLDVSNASMYDGATAVAEAALLAVRHTRRDAVVVSMGVHPETREVLATYLRPLGIDLRVVPLEDLATPVGRVGDRLDDDVACVVAQQPNFLGALEPMRELADAAHGAGALLVAAVEPASLGVLEPPGAYGADVAAGEGQGLGNPVSFGGPHFGFMVVRENLVRQLPGRLVGRTQDVDGRRGFVLTLQAREQHIRRSKAKSNICSNHQLAALMAAVNLSALGPAGLREVGAAGAVRAHRLADRIEAAGLPGVEPLRAGRFFDEFPVRVPLPPAELRARLAREGVHAGVPVPAEYGLGDVVLLAACEMTTREDEDALLAALERSVA